MMGKLMTGERKLTGWHALAIFGGAFAVIIAANLTLAVSAIRTFPGVETKNSYIASQTFDDRRNAQAALGWRVEATVQGDALVLSITDRQGRPVQVVDLQATLGRATHVKEDRSPQFVFNGHAYTARETLGPGNWNIRMTARALDGTAFQQRVVLHVKG